MGLGDLIQELKTGEPDPAKAATAMKLLGGVCLAGALWNVLFPRVVPNRGAPVPAQFIYIALIGFLIIGLLFLRSARGIHEMEPWGKKTGQLAIVLLFLASTAYMDLIILHFFGKPFFQSPDVILYLMLAVAHGQYGMLAYFGVRYLGRLPTSEDPYSTTRRGLAARSYSLSQRTPVATRAHAEIRYKDSPLPLGIGGVFAVQMGSSFLVFLAAVNYDLHAIVVIPSMLLILVVGPAAFNYLASPFERNRRRVAAFAGGGSMSFMSAAACRLVVYEDALEVRMLFHRFLIPFDKMDPFPDNVGFFTRNLLIKADVPEVPPRIYFRGSAMKHAAKVVNDAQAAFLAARKSTT
jgi:hypothetical protein